MSHFLILKIKVYKGTLFTDLLDADDTLEECDERLFKRLMCVSTSHIQRQFVSNCRDDIKHV